MSLTSCARAFQSIFARVTPAARVAATAFLPASAAVCAVSLVACTEDATPPPEKVAQSAVDMAPRPSVPAAPVMPAEDAPPLERSDIRPGELLLDDMSRCDAALQTRIGTWWYTFDDRDRPGEKACNHGSSTSEIKVILDGYPPSPCALQWKTQLESKHLYAFGGIGVGLGELNLQRYKKVFLVVRGDGNQYRVKFPMQAQQIRARQGVCGNDDWNFYGDTFACGNGTRDWVSIRIDLETIAKDPTWRRVGAATTPMPLDLSDVKSIEFQTIGDKGQTRVCDIGLVKLIP